MLGMRRGGVVRCCGELDGREGTEEQCMARRERKHRGEEVREPASLPHPLDIAVG